GGEGGWWSGGSARERGPGGAPPQPVARTAARGRHKERRMARISGASARPARAGPTVVSGRVQDGQGGRARGAGPPSGHQKFGITSPLAMVARATKTCMLMLVWISWTSPSPKRKLMPRVWKLPQPYLHWAMSEATREQAS